MDEPTLTNAPRDAGILVADAEAMAMQRAYQRRKAQNMNLFIEHHCDHAPDQLGEFVADLQAKARREALLGFLWRWALIGGGGSFLVLLLTIELMAMFSVLILSVPLALGLSLRK
ncbi:hypothetical protein Lepto7375DRAFT_7393 [Leptolyngbya sp. PCC 7375]|nr:hypothetical protein Lepto7375DRAFT_7393 [Leptolyngbya sp. PCC 7375]